MWSQNLQRYAKAAARLHEDVGMLANATLTPVAAWRVLYLLAHTTQSPHKRAAYKPRGFFPVDDGTDLEYMVFSMLFASAFDEGISSDI